MTGGGLLGTVTAERISDGLQTLALGVNAHEQSDETTGKHDAGTDEVTADKGAARGTVTDEVTEDEWSDSTGNLGDREKVANSLATNFQRENLRHCQIGRGSSGTSKKESDEPEDSVGGRRQGVTLEQYRTDSQH